MSGLILVKAKCRSPLLQMSNRFLCFVKNSTTLNQNQDTTEVVIVNLHEEELENGYLLKNSISDSTKEVSHSCTESTIKLPTCSPIESLLGRSLSDCSLIKIPKKKKIWDSTRFGDLSVGSFSTPRRATKKFQNSEIYCLTLQYYSPKAYTYARKVFNNLLPGPRTLRRWYMVVDGNPGFTAEAFEAISKQAKENIVCCNLVIDEMCIRQHVEMNSQKKMYGFINMGAEYAYDRDNIQLAKNGLVFLAVGINGCWKMPIAYFLIDGLNGKECANLLMKAIDLLNETVASLVSFNILASQILHLNLSTHFLPKYPVKYTLQQSSNVTLGGSFSSETTLIDDNEESERFEQLEL
ncbi:hypothetical protein QTP88_026692 [Uroleucon formosanum]